MNKYIFGSCRKKRLLLLKRNLFIIFIFLSVHHHAPFLQIKSEFQEEKWSKKNWKSKASKNQFVEQGMCACVHFFICCMCIQFWSMLTVKGNLSIFFSCSGTVSIYLVSFLGAVMCQSVQVYIFIWWRQYYALTISTVAINWFRAL